MLGSVTKVFTLFIILILQQNKLLNVNDKVSKYISSNKKNDFSKITILDLMNHKSGMKSMPDIRNWNTKYKNASETIEYFINDELLILKKGVFSYSNIGFQILGKIIEVVSRKSYLEIYKEYLFKPLKMNNTNIGDTNIKLYNKTKPLTTKEFNERYFASTAGGYYSTINDMIKFGKGIIKLLNTNSKTILKTLYIYREKNNKYMLTHAGGISGGYSFIEFTYDKKWNMKDIYIKLGTGSD